MNIVVLTPDKKLFEGEADRVSVPGADGEFEILTNHAPIVSALVDGQISIKTISNQNTSIPISGGFVEVLDNKISVLVQQVFNKTNTED